MLLTGDERTARSVADAVGIGEVIAGVLPIGKAAAVRQLHGASRVVAMAVLPTTVAWSSGGSAIRPKASVQTIIVLPTARTAW